MITVSTLQQLLGSGGCLYGHAVCEQVRGNAPSTRTGTLRRAAIKTRMAHWHTPRKGSSARAAHERTQQISTLHSRCIGVVMGGPTDYC
jgi:hypothetical protein